MDRMLHTVARANTLAQEFDYECSILSGTHHDENSVEQMEVQMASHLGVDTSAVPRKGSLRAFAEQVRADFNCGPEPHFESEIVALLLFLALAMCE